jgi:hypothetical protein
LVCDRRENLPPTPQCEFEAVPARLQYQFHEVIYDSFVSGSSRPDIREDNVHFASLRNTPLCRLERISQDRRPAPRMAIGVDTACTPAARSGNRSLYRSPRRRHDGRTRAHNQPPFRAIPGLVNIAVFIKPTPRYGSSSGCATKAVSSARHRLEIDDTDRRVRQHNADSRTPLQSKS